MPTQRLDWKYPDLAWHPESARPAAYANVLDDLAMDDLTRVATRTGTDGREYAVCARGGRFWLARTIDPDEYNSDGAMVEVSPTEIPYHDDCDIVEVT